MTSEYPSSGDENLGLRVNSSHCVNLKYLVISLGNPDIANLIRYVAFTFGKYLTLGSALKSAS